MPVLINTPDKGKHKRLQYSSAELSELKRVGEGIGTLIKGSGRSVEKFAYELGLGKGHLSRIIRGQADIKYCTLRTIAKGLGFKDIVSLLAQILK